MICFWGVLASEGAAQETDSYSVIGLNFTGGTRTSEVWLMQYLGLEFPTELKRSDLDTIVNKLLTTEVFVSVEAKVIPTKFDPDSYLLQIAVEEKWTTIPVIRGAFGGGTPLAVVGLYDTHTFGSLWTLGGEFQRYGSAPWGGVAWARAPRAVDGRSVHGVEAWRQFRVRTVYDKQDKELGTIRSDWSMLRLLLLTPFTIANRMSGSPHWKMGIDLSLRSEAPSTYSVADRASSQAPPKGIRLSEDFSRQAHGLVRIVYDDIFVHEHFYDGIRVVGLSGPLIEADKMHSRTELEAYYFYRFRSLRSNLAWHGLVGQVTNDSVESQYFLGGLDSLRGIPDGSVYGTRAAYLNLEWRYLTARWRYLVLQNVAFIDMGGAGQTWRHAAQHSRSTAGTGLRFSVPQVYRLMFRIDYAWSLDGSGTSGITAGMNHFFQPYRPL